MGQKIHIIGAGAMGSLIGGRLAMAFGRDSVVLIDVDEAHVRAVRDKGLRMFTGGGRSFRLDTVDVDITMPDRANKAGMDKVILATKAYSNTAALKGIARDIPLLILQNGHDEKLAAFRNAVRGVDFGVACQVMEPGCIFSAAGGRYILGSHDGLDLRTTEWAARLNKAGIAAAVTESIESWFWSRLLIGSALSPVSAVRQCALREWIGLRDARRMAKALFSEGYPIVQRKMAELRQKLRGFPAPPPVVNWILKKPVLSDMLLWAAAVGCGDFETSMLHDVRRNRPTEIDSINGAIVDLARSYGIDTPHNDWICAQIRMLASAGRKILAPPRVARVRRHVRSGNPSGVAGGNDLYTGE